MINPPKTKEEARKYKYNVWAGNPKGYKYVEHCCAYECYKTFSMFYQCHFRNGKGPNGLYCGIHARKFKAK